jgi:hypothetical protein
MQLRKQKEIHIETGIGVASLDCLPAQDSWAARIKQGRVLETLRTDLDQR